MPLTRADVVAKIDGQHIGDPELFITRDGDGFAIEEKRGGGWPIAHIRPSDIPRGQDQCGSEAFLAGPWDAYLYHSSYAEPNPTNYEQELVDLECGDVRVVICGCTGTEGEFDNDAWIFAIRTKP